MARFFTADFHLGMKDILKFEKRPFKTIEEHDSAILKMCREMTTANDTIVHVGDLCSFVEDKSALKRLFDEIRILPATFVNIRGNHDANNGVKSLCECMRIYLGRVFTDVSVGHYPSYDIRSRRQFNYGDIRICGHVHSKWLHCLDLTHLVLNVNVGIDAWNYKLVSEEQLIQLIKKLINTPNNLLNLIRPNDTILMCKGK